MRCVSLRGAAQLPTAVSVPWWRYCLWWTAPGHNGRGCYVKARRCITRLPHSIQCSPLFYSIIEPNFYSRLLYTSLLEPVYPHDLSTCSFSLRRQTASWPQEHYHHIPALKPPLPILCPLYAPSPSRLFWPFWASVPIAWVPLTAAARIACFSDFSGADPHWMVPCLVLHIFISFPQRLEPLEATTICFSLFHPYST